MTSDLRSIARMMDDRHGYDAPYDWDVSCIDSMRPDREYLTITVEDVRMVISYAYNSDDHQIPGYMWSWEEFEAGNWLESGEYGWDKTDDEVLSSIDNFLNTSL